MRKETARLIDDAINGAFINAVACYGWDDSYGADEKIDIELVVGYVWDEMQYMAEVDGDANRAFRFDGKKAIMAKIRERIPERMKEYNLEKYL